MKIVFDKFSDNIHVLFVSGAVYFQNIHDVGVIDELTEIEDLPVSSFSINFIGERVIDFLDSNDFSVLLLDGSPNDSVRAFSNLNSMRLIILTYAMSSYFATI
jgi:hypothetical protein